MTVGIPCCGLGALSLPSGKLPQLGDRQVTGGSTHQRDPENLGDTGDTKDPSAPGGAAAAANRGPHRDPEGPRLADKLFSPLA